MHGKDFNINANRQSEKKVPRNEIINRLNIIALATNMDDPLVEKEADIARSELAGYQKFREESAGRSQDKRDSIQGKQNEIDWRVAVIEIADSLDDPVVQKEADIARKELFMIRESENKPAARVASKEGSENAERSDQTEDTNKEDSQTLLLSWSSIIKYLPPVVLVLVAALVWLHYRREKKLNAKRDKYLNKNPY